VNSEARVILVTTSQVTKCKFTLACEKTEQFKCNEYPHSNNTCIPDTFSPKFEYVK
jgi:hypothetical protein